MVEKVRLGDAAIWEALKAKFGKRSFQFRDVAELTDPDRAYEFMERADDEGWIESDEEGKYSLHPNAAPEWALTPELMEPPGPSKLPSLGAFQEWYRGTKFHLGARGSVFWTSPRKVVKIRVTSGFEDVIGKIRAARPLGGSFRVDEQARILIKDQDHDYEVISLGKVKEIQFDVIDRDPRDRVKPGHIWPSIYDGARYHFSPSGKGDGKVWFRNSDGMRRFAMTGYEELIAPLLKFKPGGGGFRITETGRVLTLRYTLPVPEEARMQWENLTDEELNIIQARENPGEELRIPVFVADFEGKIELGPPFDIHKPWDAKEKEEFFAKLVAREGGDE